MKYFKRIIAALLFFLLIFGSCVFLSKAFIPKNNTATAGQEEIEANGILGEAPNSIDVLFLGDSVAYMSIIPLQLWNETGFTSYNCGTSSQTLDYSDALLRRAFENQSPKIVFLETDAIYIDHSLDDSVMTKLYETIPFFRYHNRWKGYEFSELNVPVDNTYTDVFKGYRLNNSCTPADTSSYMVPSETVTKVPDINYLYVSSMKAYCEEHGAKLVLISSPSTTNMNYERHNGIVKLANDLDLEFINMNLLQDQVPIDWNTDTKDAGDHMNYFGASKVTSFLSTYLRDSGLIESHAGDPAYAAWDTAWTEFNKIYK